MDTKTIAMILQELRETKYQGMTDYYIKKQIKSTYGLNSVTKKDLIKDLTSKDFIHIELPDEMILEIIYNLDVGEAIAMCSSNKRINHLCNDEYWEIIYYKFYGDVQLFVKNYKSLVILCYQLDILIHELNLPLTIEQLYELKELVIGNLKSLPKEIGALRNLDKLDVSGNELSFLPQQFENLNITVLKLGSNLFTTVPESLFNLTSLTFLDLGSNVLTLIPKELFNLTKLTYLHLGRNSIKILPKEMMNLVNLEYLYLNYNLLNMIPKEIGQLKKLKYLYLNNNNITVLPIEIGNLTNLRGLELDNNKLKSIPLEIINLFKYGLLKRISSDVGSWVRY